MDEYVSWLRRMFKVAQYTDNLLLVGITYERETKQHRCCIER